MAKRLSAQKDAFAREYVIDHNGTRAAIRAGYAPGKDNSNAAARASRLLREDAVLEKIQEYESALAKEFAISRDGLINRYREIYERCMEARPVLEWDSNTHRYEQTGVWQFDAKGAMKALGSIAAMTGFAKPDTGGGNSAGYEALLKALEEGKR